MTGIYLDIEGKRRSQLKGKIQKAYL